MPSNRESVGPGSDAGDGLDRIAIFSDIQAAITCMQSCELSPGQQYALRAREALPK